MNFMLNVCSKITLNHHNHASLAPRRFLSRSSRGSKQPFNLKSKTENIKVETSTNNVNVSNKLTLRQKCLSLVRPAVFTSAVFAFSATAVPIACYERRLYERKNNNSTNNWFGDVVLEFPWFNNEQDKCHNPLNRQQSFDFKFGSLRQEANQFWTQLPPVQKLFASLLSLNVAVFLAWRSSPIIPIMSKYFYSKPRIVNSVSEIFSKSPKSGADCSSMLLSTFSHSSLIHISCNMYVMYNFMIPVATRMSKEWNGGLESFAAFYICAGTFASFTSYAVRLFNSTHMVPSLGASGAIAAIIGTFAHYYPNAELVVPLLFFAVIKASLGLKLLLCMESCGVFLKWSIFDHGAHLGGFIFGGYLWPEYVKPIFEQWYERVIVHWHDKGRPYVMKLVFKDDMK